MKYALALVFLFLLSTVSANECDTLYVGGVEEQEDNPVLHQLQPLDQDSFGICYAYSATFMYDYWRRSHGHDDSGERSSPLEAAMGAAAGRGWTIDGYSHRSSRQEEKFSIYDLERGGAHDPLVYLLNEGSCDMYALDYLNDRYEVERLVRKIRDLYYTFQEYREAYDGLVPSNYTLGTGTYARASELSESIRACVAAQLTLPLDQIPNQNTIIQLLHEENPIRFLHQLIYSRCNQDPNVISELMRPRVIKQDWLDLLEEDDRNTFRPASVVRGVVDEVLARNGNHSQPVEISFCSNVYRSTYTHRVEASVVRHKDLSTYECGNHSAVIVGREMRNGQCKYLIQNHSGTECNNGPFATGVECVNGRMWVPAESLFNATFGYSHLQERTWGEYATGTYSDL